ncbi:MAG TPA: radical SAM protein [Vicinamibacterales bacterium]|nr:radical SAM protein [Vicinamibacterales bacterium]
MIDTPTPAGPAYGLRPGAEEFPLMVVISIIYPCNYGCPNCPYTDGNSRIRQFYHQRDADLFPPSLWNKLADECGPYGAWMRCTGGGEPMLHPRMVSMIEYAKARRARVWLNTNGSMFGPLAPYRARLERLLAAGIDLIEFSMDAGDAETYAHVRPPHGGPPRDPQKWWNDTVDNVKAALAIRKALRATSRVVVSIIRQELIEGKLDQAVRFWRDEIGVDEVITRKFLSWDDNTTISLDKALDPHLYHQLPAERREPCVWPFERLNVDTLGRIALCGQDVSFRTSAGFPNLNDTTIKAVWQGERFNWYRRLHLEGKGAEAWPCRGCSAWLAGVRDWQHGWLKVLKRSGDHVNEIMRRDVGVDVDVYQPPAAAEVE